MDKNGIINQLYTLKQQYEKEGFIIDGLFGSQARNSSNDQSDIDILAHTTPLFSQRYGFEATSRFLAIKKELSDVFKRPVDIASPSGMGKTAHKFILKTAYYL